MLREPWVAPGLVGDRFLREFECVELSKLKRHSPEFKVSRRARENVVIFVFKATGSLRQVWFKIRPPGILEVSFWGDNLPYSFLREALAYFYKIL